MSLAAVPLVCVGGLVLEERTSVCHLVGVPDCHVPPLHQQSAGEGEAIGRWGYNDQIKNVIVAISVV